MAVSEVFLPGVSQLNSPPEVGAMLAISAILATTVVILRQVVMKHQKIPANPPFVKPTAKVIRTNSQVP